MVAPALKQERPLGVWRAEYRTQRLAHETVNAEMTTELLAQLKGFSGIQLEGITVKLISSDNGSASYGVELRLVTGENLSAILERMNTLGWKHEGSNRDILNLHSFTKTTPHPDTANWKI